MPTYTLSAAPTRNLVLRDINGANQIIKIDTILPRVIISDTFYSVGAGGEFPELTLTADTPLSNEWLAVTSVSGTTTVTLNSETKTVFVSNFSGTGTMAQQAATNTPLTVLSSTTLPFQIIVDKKFTKLVFTETASLQCVVYESKKEGGLI